MLAIDSLVPEFTRALAQLPGGQLAWQVLSESVASSTLPSRTAALVGVTVAQRSGCAYARWVLGRLAERQWVSAEDILFASGATARDAVESAIVKAAWSFASGGAEDGTATYQRLANHVGVERATDTLSHVALALIACQALDAAAPSTGTVTAASGKRNQS